MDIHPHRHRIELEKAGPTVPLADATITDALVKATLTPGRYTAETKFAASPDASPGGYFLQMEADLYAVVTAEDVIALGVTCYHDTEIPIQADSALSGHNADLYVAWVKDAAASDGTIRINHRSRAAQLADRV